MDRKYIFYIVILTLCNTVILQGDLLYKPNNFPYSRCKQTSGNVVCEKLNFSKGKREKASLWPPGPFAIPMSKYGCPESQSRGWSKGVLTVTLAKTYEEMKLKFCVKIRHNTELDKESWIPQKYKIYKKGASCPAGFLEVIQTINHSDYETVGHLPNITVVSEEAGIATKYINITMCERNLTSSEQLDNGPKFGMLDTIFMLIKRDKSRFSHCPKFDGISVSLSMVANDEKNLYCLFDQDKRNFGESAKAVQEFRSIWYMFDMWRSLQVSKIEMSSLGSEVRLAASFTSCYYDDVMWSLLYKESLECRYRKEETLSMKTLYLMNVRARYVTMLVDENSGSEPMNFKYFKVFISDLETLDGELCNEDLGMNDGSIQDFQITASSWVSEHPSSEARPFSSGWCIDILDNSPWILVDLIAIMTVEGLSIWNIPSIDHLDDEDTPWSSFNLYYGTDADDLRLYNDKQFMIDKPKTKAQKFMLPKAVEARFIKLAPQTNGSSSDHNCLRFEIQGCKLSGIPALNCYNDSEMFGLETELVTAGETILANTNIQDCSDLCLLEENCSSTGVNEEGLCVQYMHSQYDIWKMSYGNWSAKLCSKDPAELFPSFSDENAALTANVQYIETKTVIASIGYPFTTGSSYEYRWIINYFEQRYVRFVFTNVSMNSESVEKEHCKEKLLLGTDLKDMMKGTTIDDRFNELVFAVETSETLIFMTFMPCIGKFASSKFRAIVTDEETPACLSIDRDIHLSDRREELCTKPKMILTSLSILNLPFVNVEEQFKIRARKHHSIHIQFIDFYIICPLDRADFSSKFTITDHVDERKYCNTDRPPEVINSKETSMLIVFRKYEDLKKQYIGTEGFRLQYTTKSHSLSSMTDFEDSVPLVIRECKYNGKTYENGQTFKVDGRCNTCKCEEGRITCNTMERCKDDDDFCKNVNCVEPLCEVFQDDLCCPLCKSDGIDLEDKKIFIRGSNTTKACSKKFKKCYNIFPATSTWTEAGSVCWKFNQQLVTVQSKQELQYINYLLREQRYRDNIENIDTSHASYRAHIGLKRISEKGKKKRHIWSNNYEVIYTAWKPGHPSIGDCTRTYFQPFNTNRTWESEDCFHEHADYFICQTQIEDKEENESMFYTRKGTCNTAGPKDRKELKVTYSGKRCEIWSNLNEKAKADFKERFPNKVKLLTKSSNDCKDPSKLGILGCYTTNATNTTDSANTTDVSYLWEPCFLPQDNHVYAISENTTTDGFECDSNGNVIPMVNRCDKTFDCVNLSDELFCEDEIKDHDLITADGYLIPHYSLPDRLEKGLYHLCGSNEWISVLAKCNGVIDCLDASDETDCSGNKTGCGDNEFSCEDGSCIKLSQVCDFIPDCAEAKDEFCELLSCGFNEFSCENEQCIPIKERCNAIRNCLDGSDEIECDSCRNSFLCDIGKCISYILVCDKFPDCDDGSDEKNCQIDIAASCNEFWERGYHESGQYVVDGIAVHCDFSLLDTADGQIKMDIRNLDVDIKENLLYTKSLTAHYLELSNATKLHSLIYRANYGCRIEVKSTCHFPEYAASVYDEHFAFPYCHCIVQTSEFTRKKNLYDYDFGDFREEYLDNDIGDFGDVYLDYSYGVYNGFRRKRSTVVSDIYTFDNDTLYTYGNPVSNHCGKNGTDTNVSLYYKLDTERDNGMYVTGDLREKKVPIDISVRKISCTYEYRTNVSSEMIDCDGDNTTIPKSMLCMYDVDATGYMTGCRSGSHLQDCETFSCPENTVKCPGSYCIPLRFVCDGNIHCPGGEDEHNCSCTSSSREVIVIIENTPDQSDSKTAAEKLGKQFYTSGSIVRLLYYKSAPRLKNIGFINMLLDIQEVRANEFEAFSHGCVYKSMARNLLPILRFTERRTVGIVFIEDSVKSSTVARIMFSNLSKPVFTLYRVLKDSKYMINKFNRYKFVKDIHISRWDSLHSTGYRLFPEICQDASHVPCVGGYRCSSSKQCIPLEQVCDGVIHCSNGDDERLCDFKCQKKCTCVDQAVNCQAAGLNITDILALSVNTRSADISMNPGIKDVLSQENLHFPFMFKLDLSLCEIEVISAMAFSDIYSLMYLNVSYNRIKELPGKVFINLRHLTYLNLDGNDELSVISSSAFKGLISIKHLRISGTKLRKITSYTFSNLNLESIDISYNKIEEIENYAFSNISVQKINFEGNSILKFHKRIFSNVTSLQELRTPAFKFCCISPCYVDEDKCYPSKNEFSSCGDLMRHPILQAVLWLVGIASLLGNLGSIVYRLVYDRERLKIGYGIFVTNLAAADLFMGVYLIIIAVVDSIYRNRYIFMDDQWRNSIWCTIAGVLSTVSSEASVFFLCLITLDRLLVIKYPFGTVRFTPERAHLCCGICWFIALILAVIPIVYTGHFQNRFYSRSGVCIALPLTRDKPPGWIYSVSIFVGLNFSTFILVAFGQLSIFLELRRATHGVRKTQKSRKRDLQVARNLILVATTDFLCWFPIGLMGILALNGYSISGDVYAWTAVFILPFNSALNPFLYTLSAIVGTKSFNPSVEEQSRTEVQKEIGSTILKFKDFSRSVRMKQEATPIGKTRSVQDVLKEDRYMSVATVTAISNQLANYLRLLHEASVGIEQLSETNTYIRYSRKRVKRPVIVLDTKMTLITDERMKQNNIQQFGILLRKMIASCDRKTE